MGLNITAARLVGICKSNRYSDEGPFDHMSIFSTERELKEGRNNPAYAENSFYKVSINERCKAYGLMDKLENKLNSTFNKIDRSKNKKRDLNNLPSSIRKAIKNYYLLGNSIEEFLDLAKKERVSKIGMYVNCLNS